jgi:hypothetical protein
MNKVFMQGAPSFRASCESVGITDFCFKLTTREPQRSDVPTLAENARMGHPQLW